MAERSENMLQDDPDGGFVVNAENGGHVGRIRSVDQFCQI